MAEERKDCQRDKRPCGASSKVRRSCGALSQRSTTITHSTAQISFACRVIKTILCLCGFRWSVESVREGEGESRIEWSRSRLVGTLQCRTGAARPSSPSLEQCSSSVSAVVTVVLWSLLLSPSLSLGPSTSSSSSREQSAVVVSVACCLLLAICCTIGTLSALSHALSLSPSPFSFFPSLSFLLTCSHSSLYNLPNFNLPFPLSWTHLCTGKGTNRRFCYGLRAHTLKSATCASALLRCLSAHCAFCVSFLPGHVLPVAQLWRATTTAPIYISTNDRPI